MDLPQYYEPYEVVGETKQSWLVGYETNPIKVDKKTMVERNTKYTPIRFLATIEEVEHEEYIGNRYKIAEQVRYCNDYDKLKKIELILNE
jgi:hypothetical protein